MSRTVTYLFPKASKASHLKVFQERTSQIRAFRFTKDNIKEIEALESATSYAVYFLFDNSLDGFERVYIGQSTSGISRIKNHVANKEFWSYCIMFVTDNNSFDKLSIDYMEYAFIKKLKQSSYILVNKELRENEPTISQFDKPNVLSYIEQIRFLLSTEGIEIDEIVPTRTQETIFDVSLEPKIYKPKNQKFNARIYVEDGQFVLMEGSKIVRPKESTKDYGSGNLYERFNSIIDEFTMDGKVVESRGEYIVRVNLHLKSPSSIATLISGRSENGWDFFEGLKEVRNK